MIFITLGCGWAAATTRNAAALALRFFVSLSLAILAAFKIATLDNCVVRIAV